MILAAATELLAEAGLEGLTHQAVAARAGVGRATVYRHWPRLVDLRLAALLAGAAQLGLAVPSGPDPVTAAAEPRAQTVRHLREMAARLNQAPSAAMFAAVIAGAEHDPEMHELRLALLAPILEFLRPVVTAAAAQGLIAPDTTVDRFVMFASGPLFFRRFLVGEQLDEATVEAAADAAFAACR